MAEAEVNTAEAVGSMAVKAEEAVVGSMVVKAAPNTIPVTRAVGSTAVVVVGGGRVREGTVSGPDFLLLLFGWEV